MKKSLFLIIGLLLVFSSTIIYAVSISDLKSVDSSTGKHKFYIHVGWNLIPLVSYEAESICDIAKLGENAWVYSPTAKQYWKESETQRGKEHYGELREDIEAEYRYLDTNGGGVFVYSKEECYIVFTPIETTFKKIAKGWNFLAYDKSMIGDGLVNSFYSDECTFSKVAWWDPINQKWEVIALTLEQIRDEETRVNEERIGVVMAFKYDNDCVLENDNFLGDEINPPPLLE